MSQKGLIDLYYGDESAVSMEPCIPYAWQLPDEDVFMPSSKGERLGIFGLLTRDNKLLFKTTTENINSDFVIQELESLACSIHKPTVVILDNAKVHKSAKFKAHLEAWENRGLSIFYLPTYSPHLNIIETLWRKLKYEWLEAKDYFEKGSLHYAVTQILQAFGHSLHINFSDFGLS